MQFEKLVMAATVEENDYFKTLSDFELSLLIIDEFYAFILFLCECILIKEEVDPSTKLTRFQKRKLKEKQLPLRDFSQMRLPCLTWIMNQLDHSFSHKRILPWQTMYAFASMINKMTTVEFEIKFLLRGKAEIMWNNEKYSVISSESNFLKDVKQEEVIDETMDLFSKNFSF